MTGMIEGFLGGLKLSILQFWDFLGGKRFHAFFGCLDLRRDFLGIRSSAITYNQTSF